mmetsp:Transcript_7181/g.17540  ORF Transcript_7181/g.17540 Transcript_7181/m.17540 type:complete len:600 (-) Transcript_7181:127-1926(-)|eukprot:CAMPEP_0116084538 /NCGR_PEP_ID=MMETSP0327-20121206/3853_1 /TAXON_ID=44447 /ORGANISM="Pseudo-nitzschia delicatissima, Strain B596" /LENGTH=599 /DNA_ID=CAMNT_0003575485 /DNA_START=156 /DNA_END=1955 /DNA_ORIENTATION=-
MAPSPVACSGNDHWDANQMEEHMSGDQLSPLPGSPITPNAKRKKRPPKKSPRPVSISPPSTDEEKQKTNSPRKERKDSTPPPPPLSDTPPTPNGKASTRNNKSSNKSVSKSISHRSPGAEMRYRQVANAAAEAASLRRYRRPRKRLQWKSSVRVKIINNLSNYTDQEKLDSWYWPDEYSMMEDECELTSIYMDEIAFERENVIQEEEDGNFYGRHLPDGFCERGLESWTMQGEEIKEQQVQLVIDTVWQAQIDAWEFLGNHPSKTTATKVKDDTIHDECWEFIRERASAVSRTSQFRARQFAMMDQQAVDAYLSSVRSLEQSRRRISRMLGGKHSSSRSITRSSRNLTKSKSCRTLSTSEGSGGRSICDGENNLKSILKSPPVMRRSYSDTRSLRKSTSQSRMPLHSGSEHSKDNSMTSFRIRLPKIGDDSRSSLSRSLRSNSLRSNSLRSNSLRSNSLRSNSLRSSSLRSNSLRSNRSQSVRTSSARSNHSRGNSLRSNSLRSNSVRSNSVRSNLSNSSSMSNTSKKIRYKPKSKTKIPTSPVGSVCNSVLSNSNHNSLTDEEDLSMRMMRSHMSLSVASEGSSRRRMLRVSPNPPPL